MDRSREGSVLVVMLLVLTVLAGSSASLLSLALARSRESAAAFDRLKCLYLAEAGVSISMAEITSGCDAAGDGLGAVTGFFDGGQYAVTATQSPQNVWTLTSTGTRADCSTTLEVVIGEKPCGPFQGLLFGTDGVAVTGVALCDSYDSRRGSYWSQRFGGHAGENADLSSNADIILSGTVRVYGDATPGPGGSVVNVGAVYVSGSTVPADDVTELEPYAYSPSGIDLGEITGPMTLSAGTYRCSHIWLAGGDSLSLGTMPGDEVVLYVDGLIRVTGSSQISICPGARVVLHHGGESGAGILLAGNSIVNDSRAPANLLLYSATASGILLAGGTDFYGAICARDAEITLTGTAGFFGALAGKSITTNATAIHYDEALGFLYPPGVVKYTTFSWRELRN